MIFTWTKKEKTKELDPRMIYTINKKTKIDPLLHLLIDGLIKSPDKI